MRFLVVAAYCFYCFCTFGQEAITLQECLDKALVYAPQLTKEVTTLQSSQIERKFHSWTLLPNLTASTGFNTSFGRRLDPFTNTFATTNVNSHLIGLNSSITLFNGFNYFCKRSLLNGVVSQSELSLSNRQNDVKIEVIETYVTLCKLTAQIELAKVRIEKYTQIQSLQRLLVSEGKINTVDTLKSHNAVSNEKALLSSLSGELRLKAFDLNFLIGLPLSTTHSYVLTSVSEITDKPQLTESFALEQLEIQEQQLSDQLKLDRTTVMPNLSLNGLVGTGFSTNNKDFANPGNPTKRYGDQINENLYEGIGLYLSIPIFNRGSWIKSKELNVVQQTELESTKQLAQMALEKQRLVMQQTRLNTKAQQEQAQQIALNLQRIYDKIALLYVEGRCTYTELESAFIEWQNKLLEVETLKLDYETLKLYE